MFKAATGGQIPTTRGNNVENNSKQRGNKLVGGVTGHGFLPGQSGNPKEIDTKGRTIESLLVEVLVHEALDGKNRLAAVEIILDRLEGRSRQRLEVADVTAQLRDKSDAELQFHLDNDRWPEEGELPLAVREQQADQEHVGEKM